MTPKYSTASSGVGDKFNTAWRTEKAFKIKKCATRTCSRDLLSGAPSKKYENEE